MTALQQQGQAAKAATYVLATAGTARKNAALNAIADVLTERQTEWLSANAEDVAAAKEAGMRPAMLDRLTLTPERVAGIVDGVRQVAALPDPIGRVDKMETRPNGLIIGRRRVPLGVIAIIFEARPNVTVDAAALCLKSGNVCILRGGKEAIRSNRCVAELMRQLREDGVYQLSDRLLAQLKQDFSCGCCDDKGAADVIGRLWREQHYLCDPHTAVAWSVAEQLSEELHDTGAPTVVLSTASPYKFPAAVLSALGRETGENEFFMMNELCRISGVPIPRNLAGLEGRPVLHKDVIDKDAMLDYVLAEVLKK